MNFNELIEENYRGFAQGSQLDLVDLRLMYYGRDSIFVSFTDDGEYATETEDTEMDRPDGIICYPVNDVVAQRVKSSRFYFNIFRYRNNSGHLKDIRRYTRDDFTRDVIELKEMGFDPEIFEFYVEDVTRDVKIKHPFERLWILTENLSRLNGSSNASWASIFAKLGYTQLSDPTGTGIIAVGRSPVSLLIDHTGKEEVDILPAQKKREDPRTYVRDRVARRVKTLRNSRKRIAKRAPTRGQPKMGFINQLKQAAQAFGGLDV